MRLRWLAVVVIASFISLQAEDAEAKKRTRRKGRARIAKRHKAVNPPKDGFDTNLAETPSASPATAVKDVAKVEDAKAPAAVLGLVGGSLFKNVAKWWPLAVVGLLSFGLVWLFWRRQKQKPQDPNAIRVLASRPLGPKARVTMLQAGGRTMLLSVGDRGANLITEWTDVELTEAESAQRAQTRSPDSQSSLVDRMFGKDAAAGLTRPRKRKPAGDRTATLARMGQDAEWTESLLAELKKMPVQ